MRRTSLIIVPYAVALNPSLLAFYLGWLGQKIITAEMSAAEWDDQEDWLHVTAEFDRFCQTLRSALEAETFGENEIAGVLESLKLLVRRFGENGWWHSEEHLAILRAKEADGPSE